MTAKLTSWILLFFATMILAGCSATQQAASPTPMSKNGNGHLAGGAPGSGGGSGSDGGTPTDDDGGGTPPGGGPEATSGGGTGGGGDQGGGDPGGTGGGGNTGGGGGNGGGGNGGGGSCGPASADFYVATNGNDNWSGTLDVPSPDLSDGPFATLDRARKAVHGTVGRRALSHDSRGQLFLERSRQLCSSGFRFRILPHFLFQLPMRGAGYQRRKADHGWTNTSGNIWTAKLNSSSYQNFEALYFNGQRRFRPRAASGAYLRNVGPVYSPNASGSCSVNVGGQWQCFDRFIFSNNDVGANYHSMALGDVEILDFEKWTMSRMRLKSVDTSSHIAYLTGPTRQIVGNFGFMPGHRYLIENVKESLSQPGQWYLDRCANPPSCTNANGTWTLTYLAQANENPNNAEVIVPQQSQVLIANGLQHVTFQGITFAHDNWMPPAEGR